MVHGTEVHRCRRVLRRGREDGEDRGQGPRSERRCPVQAEEGEPKTGCTARLTAAHGPPHSGRLRRVAAMRTCRTGPGSGPVTDPVNSGIDRFIGPLPNRSSLLSSSSRLRSSRAYHGTRACGMARHEGGSSSSSPTCARASLGRCALRSSANVFWPTARAQCSRTRDPGQRSGIHASSRHVQ